MSPLLMQWIFQVKIARQVTSCVVFSQMILRTFLLKQSSCHKIPAYSSGQTCMLVTKILPIKLALTTDFNC